MAPIHRAIVAASVVCLSTLPSLPSFRRLDWTSASRGWARGPVWYIMTTAEYGLYRRLRSEPERREFIRSFWSRRDPVPDTPENELESEFWRRVEVADGHFGQDVKPGWKTERGKVFIMLGPPDNFDHDHILADTWGASGWIYDLGSMPLQLRLVLQDSLGIPSSRRIVKLKVRADNIGARWVAGIMASQGTILRPTSILPLAEHLVRRIAGPNSLRSLGHAMRVPEVMERSRSRVDVTTVFSLLPVRARIDFRPAAPAPGAEPLTAVAVTLGVSREDLLKAGVVKPEASGALLTGYLTSVDDDRRSYPLAGSLAPGGGRDQVFQAICRVPPGRYLLDAAYQDTQQRLMGSVRELVDVPAFAVRRLGVGSLVLSSRLDRLERPQGSGGAERPFTLGSYLVIPRTTRTYGPSESLTVFYQIFGARVGADGLAHLDLTYQFYLDDAGTWLPVGSPFAHGDQSELEQAWSVPLERLPPGRYRLEVTVTDREADATATRGALFEITPPSAA